MEMKIATNVRPIEGIGYQLVFDNSKRIVSINLLYDNKILIKNKFSEPIVVNSDKNIKDIVDSTVLEYFNTCINNQLSNSKIKKTKADFYANVMSPDSKNGKGDYK